MDILFLHNLLAAACPIDGVSVGDPADKSTWRIDFTDSATPQQKAAAAALLAAFDPNEATPADLRAQKIIAGLTIVSTGTPAVSGTYALDDETQSQVEGLAFSANGGLGLPAGWQGYPDITGAPKPHTGPTIVALFKAMRDYLFALDATAAELGAGQQASWPPASVTIA